jgi:mono/diheme cytochrome c family protein
VAKIIAAVCASFLVVSLSTVLADLPPSSSSMLSLIPNRFFRTCLLLSVLSAGLAECGEGPATGDEGAAWDGSIRPFLRKHCVECHSGESAEGGLNLTQLPARLADPKTFSTWVKVHDKLRAKEMPPADAEQPRREDADAFLNATGDSLRKFQAARQAELGRVRTRRLTRREIERTFHDLLGIDIPLADQLPEEARPAGFTTVADDQAMSHFQLEAHLAVVDAALDEAFRRAFSPPDQYERDFDASGVARRDSQRRTREPEMLNGKAVVWSSGLIFYGRIPATIAPESGWYHFTVEVSALKPPDSGGVWSTVRTGLCVSSAPLLGHVTAFEATEKPKVVEFEAWLPKGHMLEIRPGDATLKRARFAGGQVGAGEGEPQDVPGIAIDRITMKRIHHGPDNAAVRRLLFGELTAKPKERRRSFELVSTEPRKDAERLMRTFARHAFRRPVTDEQMDGYLRMVQDALDQDYDLLSALRIGYRSLLSSPRLLYLIEMPGSLDDFAIAARLSYLLTGSTPDTRLAELADAGRLHDPAVLRAEASRLLSGSAGRRFVKDFAAEWLDLDQIDFTQPDTKLFPEFDSIVQNSMLDETHTYLETMLRDNLSVTHLLQSDYTFLNSRLARFYDIKGVEGDSLQRVALQPKSHRGGVLTQGAILKVTANGSNTSPVVRGVWVSEQLLGVPIPPPPDNVPAIEPDIRGATTVREQLAKHRSQPSCASCHVKIDPPGFALENFDPAGQWRERYTQSVGGRRSAGAKVDASYVMPDGREFADVDDFRALVIAEPRKLAANVAEKLLVYGTGAPITFADREAIERIADESAKENYGFRSIVDAVITSPVFLSK